MKEIFTCPKCKGVLDSFYCSKCGYHVPQIDSVWQLTDAPDIKTDGNGDKYIGYEYNGENYSGNRKYLIEERDALFTGIISKLTGDGVFLDLGCGDGFLTVPCAANGTKVIAGDISTQCF